MDAKLDETPIPKPVVGVASKEERIDSRIGLTS